MGPMYGTRHTCVAIAYLYMESCHLLLKTTQHFPRHWQQGHDHDVNVRNPPSPHGLIYFNTRAPGGGAVVGTVVFEAMEPLEGSSH